MKRRPGTSDDRDPLAPNATRSRRRGSVLPLITDVLRAIRSERKLWLAPLLLFLLILAAMLVLISVTGPLASFVYPLI